jgi:signal transduction histidine kinase
MERGTKTAKARAEGRRSVATDLRKDEGPTLHELEKRLAEVLEQQAATTEILRLISISPTDAQPVFETIVRSAVALCGSLFAVVIRYDGELLHYVASHNTGPSYVELLKSKYPRPPDVSQVSGRVILSKSVVTLKDARSDPDYDQKFLAVMDWRRMLGVPMLRDGRPLGVIVVGWAEPGSVPRVQEELLRTFADQAVIAIENVRLFRAIEDKSQQLEKASRHKSEFLANMSHELRTPLNAIIGFSEVLSERMFGEINDKQAEYLSDILESGRHLLSLINDILDLSKIEAGRMELEPTDFHLPGAIENTLTLVRERAHRYGITLERTVDDRLGMIRADERKLKQVLLNLLSNALKFTPQGGRIDVRAAAHGAFVEISVTDTGVGIAPEDQPIVFEEFRQVGAAAKKIEGTGLGLAISRKFIELHGGSICVTSRVGTSSTFTFTLPLTIDQGRSKA